MRSSMFVVLVLMVLISPLLAPAESGTPDLKGTWIGDFSILRTAYPKKTGPNPLAYTKPGLHKVSGVTYVIDEQEGALFSGTEVFGKISQKIVGVIYDDNKTLYLTDQTGLLFGKLIAPNKMRLMYLENGEHGQVAASGIVTRGK
jgi:hypothetical protein